MSNESQLRDEEQKRNARGLDPLPFLPSSTLNPFEDLDNSTISYLLSFIDAPDALRLAKSCCRLFNIHQQTRNRRLFHRYDIVIMDFTQNRNLPWKVRLGDSCVSVPTKPLFVNFVNENIENPDLTLNYGPLLLQAKLDRKAHQEYFNYPKHSWSWMSRFSREWKPLKDGKGEIGTKQYKKPMPTMNCYVQGGAERLGMLAVFKFLQEYFVLDQLFIDEADIETIDFYPLPLLRHLQVFPAECRTENAILRLVRAMPSFKGLLLRGPNSYVVPAFYDRTEICKLESFTLFGEFCDVDFSQVKWLNFMHINETDMRDVMTPDSIKMIVDEWQDDQREIGFWRFLLHSKEAIKQLLGDSFTNSIFGGADLPDNGEKFEQWSKVLESKSGKKLKIRAVHYGYFYDIVLTTVVDCCTFWFCSQLTFH